MKHLGRRAISMLLILGVVASMLASDLSVMQVYATESTANMENTTSPDLMPKESESETVVENSSEGEIFESIDMEEPTEEESREECSSEEIESVTETSQTEIEDSTEIYLSTEETTEESVSGMETTEEMTSPVTEGMLKAQADKTVELGADDEGVLAVPEGTVVAGKVKISADVKVIPKGIFDSNDAVTSIEFETGSQLQEIKEQAFMGSYIESIRFPASLEIIGDKAFQFSRLKNIVFVSGDKKVTLGKSAFADNSNLKTVTTNGRLGIVGESAFSHDIKLEKTVDLSGVTSIGKKAFFDCESLDYIEIPNTVTIIEESTFEGCKTFGKGYTEAYRGDNAVRLGDAVSEIKDTAFKGCTNLERIILPKNVNKLGRDAFGGCTSLKVVEIRNESGTDPTNACNISLTYTSFPNLKGLVLKAYDGTVEDWVGSHSVYGVRFESLYKNYSIKIATCNNGSVVSSVKSAKYGDTVTLTVKPNAGYVLESYESLWYECAEEAVYGNKPYQIDPLNCSFQMPASDITIYAYFSSIDMEAFGSELVLTEDDLYEKTNPGENAITFSTEDNRLSFSKPWQGVRIRVTGDNGKVPMYDQLKFTSSNTKAVTIDEKGYIRALAPTQTTKITVSFINKKYTTEPLTFTVSVAEETFVEEISLDYKAARAKLDKCTDLESEAANIGYDVITYPSSLLNTEARTIRIIPQGTDADGDRLDISYQLISNDGTIAKPGAAKFMTEGKLTIPKGAIGETVVTVKAIDKSDKPAEKQFIVRVIDDTPRLAQSTINVDPQSEKGAFIDLVSVYEANPDVDKLSICKKVVNKGNTVYEDQKELFEVTIDEDTEAAYLHAKKSDTIKYIPGKNYTYKNTYYIHGTLKNTDTEFYIPIPNLTICQRNIKPTVKLSGKINLFYNGKATEAQLGTVTVTQNQKDLVVESCELVGVEKANGVDNADDNAFLDNFDVELTQGKTQTITITRSDTEKLSCYSKGKSKGKPVLNGIFRIKYEGYSDPFEIKITVPTHTTVPSFVLDTTKISLNSRATGQEYDVRFKNKKTGEIEDLVSEDGRKTVVSLDISDNGTTDGLIEEDPAVFRFDADSNKIHLKIANAKKGKIVLILRQPEWEDQSEWNKKSIVKATITVSVSNAFPTAKFGKATLNLNKACPEATDYTNITLSQSDSILMETQEFVSSGKNRSDAIEVSYTDGKVIAKITDDQSVKPGSYSYICYPNFKFKGSDRNDEAKAITVKVVVKDTQPAIKLKKTSFVLNANCQKKEDGKYDYVITDFSWTNLPPEYESYELSVEDMNIRLKQGRDNIGKEYIRFEPDDTNNKVKIYVEAPTKRIGQGTYIISGLKLSSNFGKDIPIADISITLNNSDKTPTVSVSAKGTINPLDSESKIEYTPKLTNINGTVEDVEIREISEDGTYLEDTHFEASHDTKTGKTIVKVKESDYGSQTGGSRVQLENRTYKIQLFYTLSNGNGESKRVLGTYQVAKDQKIIPRQTMPRISVDTKNATFFAGDKSRTTVVKVTKAKNSTADISGIKFSNKTPLYLQNAFVIDQFDKDTGEMVLRLKNSAFIQQNKEQTLTFEIVCDGQLKNTVGTTFTVKVKVIK